MKMFKTAILLVLLVLSYIAWDRSYDLEDGNQGTILCAYCQGIGCRECGDSGSPLLKED